MPTAPSLLPRECALPEQALCRGKSPRGKDGQGCSRRPRYDGAIREMQGRFYEVPNRVSLIGLLENPMDEQLHVADVAGGANVVVASGRRTAIVDLRIDRNVARGKVITVDDGAPVNRGKIVVTLQPDGRAKYELSRNTSLSSDGRFVIELGLQRDEKSKALVRAKALQAQAHYLGSFMLADCTSETVSLTL